MKFAFFTDVFEFIKNFTSWIKENRATPEGRAVLLAIGLSIVVGVSGSFISYKQGEINQETKDLLLFEKQDKKMDNLQIKVDALQSKLANRDCTDEIRRWKSLFEDLYLKTSDKSLELENERDRELREVELAETIKRREQEKTKELINIRNNIK